MGKFSKSKGSRVERNIVNSLKAKGIPAERIPLSGALPHLKNDLILPWLSKMADGEVKARHDGFKEIIKWIAPVKVLFIKADRKEPLAVIRLSDFAELLSYANDGYRSQLGTVPADWLSGRLTNNALQ